MLIFESTHISSVIYRTYRPDRFNCTRSKGLDFLIFNLRTDRLRELRVKSFFQRDEQTHGSFDLQERNKCSPTVVNMKRQISRNSARVFIPFVGSLSLFVHFTMPLRRWGKLQVASFRHHLSDKMLCFCDIFYPNEPCLPSFLKRNFFD